MKDPHLIDIPLWVDLVSIVVRSGLSRNTLCAPNDADAAQNKRKQSRDDGIDEGYKRKRIILWFQNYFKSFHHFHLELVLGVYPEGPHIVQIDVSVGCVVSTSFDVRPLAEVGVGETYFLPGV